MFEVEANDGNRIVCSRAARALRLPRRACSLVALFMAAAWPCSLRGGLAASAGTTAAGALSRGAAPVRNGNFDHAENGIPGGWSHGAWQADGRTTFTWQRDGGPDGSGCLAIETSGSLNDAWWSHKIELEPRTAYMLRGMVKGESIAIEADGRAGANLCVLGLWGCFSGGNRTEGSFDWRRHEIDFATGESGAVEIACRLGHWSSTASGKAWFDNIEVVPNPDVVRCEGKHVYLNLYQDDLAVIGDKHLQRWIAHLDAAYEAMADLTGRRPFDGAKIGIYSTRWYPGGWAVAGNPILWMKRFVRESLARADKEDDWCSGILHELGHDFDSAAWSFDGEFFANLNYYYAIETLNGRVNNYTGREYVTYWKSDSEWSYEKAWLHPDAAKRSAHHDGLQYKWIVIRDRIGWEPFRKTFRFLLALPPAELPRGGWAKLKLFHDKLAEFSGFDVWSVYSAEELDLMRAEYR